MTLTTLTEGVNLRQAEEELAQRPVNNMTPKQIVEELNKYVIGQDDAKRAVAISFRNRWRRRQLIEDLKQEVIPKNILMTGPTGVGKTEIARRMAKLTDAPFIKVEATKFTEVGYVGKDVESIIRDVLEVSINLTKNRMKAAFMSKAEQKAEERIIVALVGETASTESRKKFEKMFKDGELDDKEVEITILDQKSSQPFDMPSTFDIPGAQIGMISIGDILGKNASPQHKNVKMKVADAYKHIIHEELEQLMDRELIIKEAIKSLEEDGIVFIDEIDKIASKAGASAGGRGEVSREGVQRDLLPIVEGSIVNTKYGPVDTRHILFIAAGAFHEASPSDLLPELQGRFPVVVNLNALKKEDMIRILKEPQHSLIKQYTALLGTESVDLEFTDDGVERIASIAYELNTEVENIGARRLHTVMEKMFEELNYSSDAGGVGPRQKVVIDVNYADSNLKDIIKPSDLEKFVL